MAGGIYRARYVDYMKFANFFSLMDWQKQVDRMRIFVCFEGERKTLDVSNSETIRDLIERVREVYRIGPDNGPAGMELEDQKILSLTYAGAVLNDKWFLGDLGIPNGCTLKAILKAEVKPSVYIYCAFNDEVVPILDKVNIQTTTVAVLRGMVSRQVGLPVSVFRLINKDGVEMFDKNTLMDYGVNLRDKVRLDVWDGWREFLNLCIMGFTRHVMAHLPHDDVMARFYMKTAMYIAAHFGHVDLAVTLLKQGIKADEPIGEHPMRQWCKEEVLHIDVKKAPVHVAAEAGSLAVLRSYVHNSVNNVLARDGNGLTPLNLALRKKQKPCASFLLTKQWSKVPYTKKHSVPLSIFVKMKRWGERAKDKTLVVHGQWKSSIKNPKKHVQIGALLGQGVQLDGFSKSRQTTKPEAEAVREQQEEQERFDRMYSNPIPPPIDPDVYFRSVKMMQENLKLPRLNKFNKAFSKASVNRAEVVSVSTQEDVEQASTYQGESESTPREEREDLAENEVFDTRQPAMRPRSNSHGGYKRLPPITEKKKGISQSQQNLSTVNIEDPEFRRTKKHKLYEKENKAPGKTVGRSVSIKASQSSPTEGKMSKKPKSEGDVTSRKSPTKRKERNAQSAVLIAKVKTEGGSIPLPMHSSSDVPRPFIRSRSEDLTKGTLDLYERYRGIGSRDYAIKCLTVANTFSEKPWLQQVQQALTIAKQGVKKAVAGQSHLFTPREGDLPEEETIISDSYTTSRITTAQTSTA